MGSTWVRFNLVGILGFALQVSLLTLLTRMTSWPVAVSVSAAVLVTVSHNFLWHVRYTWAAADTDRNPQRVMRQWAAFNLTNGGVSLAANTLVTGALAAVGWPVPVANMVAVGVASLINFLISDRIVFARARSRQLDSRGPSIPDPGFNPSIHSD